MGAKAPDTRRTDVTTSGDSGMEYWHTSLWGIERQDDGQTDEEKSPPPAPTPPGTMTPVDEETTTISFSTS